MSIVRFAFLLRENMPRLTDTAALLLVLMFAGTLFFFRLGAPGFFDADEPAYAQAAREMR